MADEVTPGCEIAARLANVVREEDGGTEKWIANDFMPDICASDSVAFARLCDHLHNTLASDASDSAKLAAIRDYIEPAKPVDPWLVAMREAFATRCDISGERTYARLYRKGEYDGTVKKTLAAFRAKLEETA